MLFVSLAVATVGSILATRLTIAVALKLNVGGDTRPGVQRFHVHWAPRIGGLPVLAVLLAWLVFVQYSLPDGDGTSALAWAICLAPAFGVGLMEDLTGRAGVYTRLWLAMASAGLAWWLLDARLLRFGVASFDDVLIAVPAVSLLFTVLMAAGVAHSVNIIDGYNGLAGSYLASVLLAIIAVAVRIEDSNTAWTAAGGLVALIGFLVWNFPHGKIFLGDAGAYALGLFVAVLCVRLVNRSPDVSTMFPALLLCYPVWETLFSVFRKRRRGNSPSKPDGLHFHMLVHKRLVRSVKSEGRERVLQNSATTAYLSVFTLGVPTVAAIWWDNSLVLLGGFVACIGFYQYAYSRLVRFDAPAVLVQRP